MSELFDRQVFPDRPWKGRGYGRMRLDEPHARDLLGIMHDVVHERLHEYHQAKGSDTELAAKFALRRATELRKRVRNLIVEQGWQDKE
jgi:hypothetical protein